MADSTAIVKTPSDRIKDILSAQSVQQQFENALKENSGAFIASIIDLYNTDKYLQKCDPKAVIFECLKAASLKLPINKSLGFAFIVPYSNTPQFQMGWKGYVQLALRTAQYRHINADIVYEGQYKGKNFLTGEADFSGEKKGNKIAGYFAHFELLNGFAKTLYMTADEVQAHAKRYSKSFNTAGSAWKTDYDKMAIKTVIRLLLSKYGIMSTEMTQAIEYDYEDENPSSDANKKLIDLTTPDDPPSTKKAAKKIEDAEPAQSETVDPKPETKADPAEDSKAKAEREAEDLFK